MNNLISASIVVHNTSPSLLQSVVASLRADGVENIIIIDNSPTTALEAQAHALSTEYLHTANNGYGAGHNIAMRMAHERGMRYHLVVNPDVRWEPGVIPFLTNYFESHPDCGQLMPLTRYPDGRLQHTCRLLPTPLDLFCKRFLPSFIIRRRMKRYLLPPEAYKHPINSPYLLGSFMYFRMAAIRSVGLFDERFFMYPEDIDITRRIHAGWFTMMLPDVEIIHDHAAASRHNMKMLWIHITNIVKYFNKWGWWLDPQRRAMNRRLLAEIKKSLMPE